MKTSVSFSVLIWANVARAKNNEAPLYARITVNKKRVSIGLKRKVNLTVWDSKKAMVTNRDQNARLTNKYIDQVKAQLFQAFQELKGEGKMITSVAIKERYLGTDQEYQSLEDLIDYHNTTLKDKLHKDTMRHYKSSQSYLRKFIKKKFKTSDIYLKDLNYSFIIGFESFLRAYQPTDHQRRIGNNTVMKHIQRLRKMVTMAFHMEWIIRDPFVKFKSTYIKSERTFLTEEELKSIEELDSEIERINLVKDLFIFSCYTGISYSDIVKLTTDNVLIGMDGGNWIVTKRQKTGTPVKIPILEPAQNLILKYKDNLRAGVTGTLFPTLSNQKINTYLKEIADLCGIKKNLTFHMARHTFATTITLTNGVPIETVSKLLGHTKLATTQIYARVIEQKVSDDMNVLKTLLSNKSKQNLEENKSKSSS
ncbi:Site-specific recombinase XerD [Lutibacter oricola]|uniref:Site-specific recombinase XerD n=1 Tax=Lutibacter oricola TaxID=762486 RepID=A0A1H3CJK9_9FLAO|nr:site-specific integrase [Lutibacter oricola]SDX54442.1 Site-specific recombinase XerD [Lutibacter oricola]